MKRKGRHRIKKYYWLIKHLLSLIIKNNIMYSKIKELVSSVRFLQLVIVAILQIVAKEVPDSKSIIDAVSALLVGSVAIGTIDRASTKIGGK